jgi:protein gp37
MNMDETEGMQDDLALVPLTEALPELRAADYADVRTWHDARMDLEGRYDAADGEYLKRIRDTLTSGNNLGSGLWTGYLSYCRLPERTARFRIQQAEGRYIRQTPATVAAVRLPEPEPEPEPSADDGESETTSAEHEDEGSASPLAREDDPPEPAPQPAPEPRHIFSIAEWAALDLEERATTIAAGHEGKAGLNEQKSDNIEWALWSWNPVMGCLHNCPYCYARDIANRFYPQGFTPAFQPNRLGAPYHQRVPQQAEHELGYRNIFTCSMADLFGKWVPTEWIEAVLDVARDCPQWNFLFLTKFPNWLAEFTYPENAWLGTSVDCQARVKNAEQSFAKMQGGVKWLSIEPMLEPLKFTSLEMFNWVVIGGASQSSATPAWIPPRRWVLDLECQARDAGCMIYEKTNLGMNCQSRLREYPGWERQEAKLPAALTYIPSIGKSEA